MLPSHRFIEDWNLCSALSNYLSTYISYEFEKTELAENLISMVLNELLEAVCFSSADNTQFFLTLQHTDNDGLKIDIRHNVRPEIRDNYCAFIKELGALEDPAARNDLYMNLLTEESADDLSGFNQLGLAMIVSDFGVNFILDHNEKNSDSVLDYYIRVEMPNEEFVG